MNNDRIGTTCCLMAQKMTDTSDPRGRFSLKYSSLFFSRFPSPSQPFGFRVARWAYSSVPMCSAR